MEFGVQCVYTKEIRCKKCRRLLMKGDVKCVEIKCPKCGYIQKIGKEVVNRSSSNCEVIAKFPDHVKFCSGG